MHALLRFDVFLVILLVMMAWEDWRPRRMLVRPRRERWLTNLSLTMLNTLLVWGTVGGIAYTTALFAAEKEIRVCCTYRAEPALGQEKLEIGLSDYPNPLNLGELLISPFRSEAGQYPFTGMHPAHT